MASRTVFRSEIGRRLSRSDELHELLADVLALEQSDERPRRARYPFRHRLAITDSLRRHVLRKLGKRLRPQFHVLADDETLHQQAVDENRANVLDRDR